MISDLSARATPGATFALRATPRARRRALEVGEDGTLRVWVTEPADEGRATEAVRAVLAEALGVAKSRLTLLRGATAREKLFRLD